MSFHIPQIKTVNFIREISGTNNSPLLFLYSSGNDYDSFFLKCVRRDIEHSCLVYEFICSFLAGELNLHTPEAALAYIQKDSYEKKRLSPYQNTIRPGATVFASRQVRNVTEANNLEWAHSKAILRDFERLEDLLRISLFDLVIDNRDRNRNNLNLLISQEKKRKLIVIDHYNTFGGPGNAGKAPITRSPYAEGTLLGAEFCQSILCHVEREKLTDELEAFTNSYASIDVVKIVDTVFDQIPSEWLVSERLRSQLKQFLADNRRIKSIIDKTRTFILSRYH